MDREEAKNYLERKGKLVEPISKQDADKQNEKEIQKVIKKGKIYGDPIAEIQW